MKINTHYGCLAGGAIYSIYTGNEIFSGIFIGVDVLKDGDWLYSFKPEFWNFPIRLRGSEIKFIKTLFGKELPLNENLKDK